MNSDNHKTVEYALEALLPYPPKILKEIRPNQATKNNINQPMRWTQIAFSKDLDALKKHLTSNRRIINWDNLEVVCYGEGVIHKY